MKKIVSLLAATAIAAGMAFPSYASSTVTDAAALASAVNRGGEVLIGADIDVDQLRIDSNVTIDGQGHTLKNVTKDVSQAAVANKSDNIAATFKNIILDGGGRTMSDVCLWMGRGSWDWYDVTVKNWKSSSSGNRGALTLGKSANSPGTVNIHSSVITDNHLGLSLDQSETVANIYGCVIENNEKADVNITSGTVNFIDDDEKSEKKVGKLVMSGGTLNLSGNTAVSEIDKNGGIINITGKITSDAVTKISLPRYGSFVLVARLQNGADSGVLDRFTLSDNAPQGARLEVRGSGLWAVNPDGSAEDISVTVDYDSILGESSRLASGSLHAMDYKRPAGWLTDGVIMTAVRGQAHQKDFDKNYEYLPGIFDEDTYGRIVKNNPDTKLMVGLYYGFKPLYGSDWQNAALKDNGAEWKKYIDSLMDEAEGKNVYSWIPWNEPDLQWGGKFTSDFRTAFRYAYEAVKAHDKDALVQGPENCKYSFGDLTAFLTYCKNNGCLPDVLSWHELTASRSETEAHCKELRDWMVENEIEPMPFAITEYQGTGYGTTDSLRISQGTYNPGLCAAYIAGMERAEKYGLKFALKSAWGLSGSNPNCRTDMGQMADFENGNMPTGIWYVYNAYRLMSGVKVSAETDVNELECLATSDASTDAARSVVLIGNWKQEDKTVALSLVNIPDYLTHDGKAHIEAEVIRETLATANYGTDVIMSEDVDIADGSCRVSIPTEGRCAVVVKITPSAISPVEFAAHSLKLSLSGEMRADIGDVLTVTGGSPGTYIDAEAISPKSETTYKESGDSADFTVKINKDGLYNISVSHRKDKQNGFVQLYADGVSF